MRPVVSAQSEKHLVSQYSGIPYESECLQRFMHEVAATMRRVAGFSCDDSLLDIGCGRGYFLRFLKEQGQKRLCGLEPCLGLATNGLAENVKAGSFEENGLADDSFDVVYTCHTLHHVPDSYPVQAVKEMLRISRKYIVIVEINNTNLPMYVRSLIQRSGEVNAYKYNKILVASLLNSCSANVLHSTDLKSSYISGDSILHKLMYHLGSKPYNITIASK